MIQFDVDKMLSFKMQVSWERVSKLLIKVRTYVVKKIIDLINQNVYVLNITKFTFY